MNEENRKMIRSMSRSDLKIRKEYLREYDRKKEYEDTEYFFRKKNDEKIVGDVLKKYSR